MNILLDDKQRELYKPVIEQLFALCPDTMQRKIKEANVQQAFVFNTVLSLRTESSKILCIGSHEDTAYEALGKSGIDVVGIDPLINMSLDTFYKLTKDTFDIIFSTSVIEHVEDDELFIGQICQLLKDNGVAILTCDFRDDYKEGDTKPNEDKRLYTKNDLTIRLRTVALNFNCDLFGKINYDGESDFVYGIHKYSFATFLLKKTIEHN